MLTFYFTPGASSMAPHIALFEVGAAFEARPISLAKKENRAPAYLAINPEGKVPTLVIDGRPMTEVAGILFYLAKRYPEFELLPTDVEGEARAVSWMSFIAAFLHPARGLGPEVATERFKIADQRLGKQDWALDRYSVADIHLFRLSWRLIGSFKLPRGTFPSLEAHYDRMMARPAVKRTIEVESAIGYDLP
jgi:glutathione S-transferase